jgi:type IV secretion system pilin
MLKNKIKIKAILSLICALIIFIPLVSSADIPILEGDAFKDLNRTAGGAKYATSGELGDVVELRMHLTKTLIQYILGLLGIIFLVLIIWGGYDWMFSGGNEERVTKAKQKIKMAVNGLIIILAAYILTSFIFNSLAQNTIQGT